MYNSQLELEQSLITEGANNFLTRTQRNDISSKFNIINKCHESVTDEIISTLRKSLNGDALTCNVSASGIKLLLEITPEVVTALTLRIVLNSIDEPIPLTQLSFQIANELIQQHKFTKIVTENRITNLKLDAKVDFRWGRKETFINRIDEYIEEQNLTQTEMSHSEKSKVGLFLLHAIQRIGIITIKTIAIGAGRKQYQVKPSELLSEYIDEHRQFRSGFFPLRQPMIEPPKDWVNLDESGGYHGIQNRLVRGANKTQINALRQSNLANVLSAVNKLQQVEWRIDTTMLDLINTITVNCPDMCETTRIMDVVVMREYPKEGTEKDQNQWKFESFLTSSQNNANFSKKTRLLKTVSIANKYKDYETIYFPHNLDKRGRTYPIPTIFHPQGDDVSKSLLLLKPQVVTGNGEYWLKVNIANLFGMDKLDFTARISWFDRHLNQILEDPIDGSRFWCKASNPLTFLQASLDYKNYLETGESSVVCRVDATCSAVQHIATLLRDTELAKLTNITKTNQLRHDFYQTVADILQSNVDNDSSHNEADQRFMADWSGKVSRKLVKPSVMTNPFNISPRGVQRQFINYVKANSTPSKPLIHHDNTIVIDTCSYLQKKLTSTLNSSFPQLGTLRKHLRKNTKAMSKNGESPQWTLPSGFTYKQHDIQYESSRVIFRYNERKCQLRLNINKDESLLNITKQGNSVTANLIHSLDGCHVHMTANECDFEITTIHDSMGSHCNNMEALQVIIRNQYTLLHHSFDINSIFDTDEPLGIGDFDINEVTDNPYFFS